MQLTDTGTVAGFDKHYGRALCYITINRNIYWWTRITINSAIDLRENTDPCSPIKQYQIIREEPLSLDIESMVPGPNNASAASYLSDFQAGTPITKLECSLISSLLRPATAPGDPQDLGNATNPPVLGIDSSKYGTFVIEKSNADISRDDFTSLKLTIRGLGYGDDTKINSDSVKASEFSPGGYSQKYPVV